MKLSVKKTAAVFAAGLLLLFFNGGCSGNRPLFGGANLPALLGAHGRYLSQFNYTDTNSANFYLKLYTAAGSSSDKTAQVKMRNQILADLMVMIDYNYFKFENNFRGDKTVQELGADIATLGLTAASTVAGGAETKTILSAIATGVVGVNSSIDKEVYQNSTVQALQFQMRAQRSAVEINLYKGMTNSIQDYPLEFGLRDIIAYYHAGSLTEALFGLVQSASSSAQTNQAAAKAVRP